MNELRCLKTFIEVARRNSFSGAADHFGVSRASVTKQIAWLEKSFNTKLINRTTKQMGLTKAGENVLKSASALLGQYDEMHELVNNLSGEISGEIRIGVPPSFGTRRMLPVIEEFLKTYPEVTFSVTLLTVRKEETFVEQGLDVGIIIVPVLRDSSHVAIQLASAPQALVASPAYIASRPALRSPNDLSNANCLINLNKSPTSSWTLIGQGGPMSIGVKGNLKSDFGDSLKGAAIAGMGVSMHPYYMVADELESGLLQVVLPEYPPTSLDIYAIYSSRKNIPIRLRLFLDFLREWAVRPKTWEQASFNHT